MTPTIPDEIKQRVNNQIKTCWKIAKNTYPDFKLRLPVVYYTKRGGVAGTANSFCNRLNFNPTLLMKNLENGFIAQTVTHECAHLIANHVYNTDCKHGNLWKRIMLDLGVKPERCHNYDMSHLKPHKWHCACQTHNMSKRMHNAMMKGVGRRCKKCKTTLSPGPLTHHLDPPKRKISTSRIDWTGTSFRKDKICEPTKNARLLEIIDMCDGTQTVEQLFNDVKKAKKQIRTLARRGYAIELNNGKIKISC